MLSHIDTIFFWPANGFRLVSIILGRVSFNQWHYGSILISVSSSIPFNVAPVDGREALGTSGEVRDLSTFGSTDNGLIRWFKKAELISSHWSGFGGSGSAAKIENVRAKKLIYCWEWLTYWFIWWSIPLLLWPNQFPFWNYWWWRWWFQWFISCLR